MRTKTDIITEVLVRNNRTTTDGFITNTMLTNWYTEANYWASDFEKWPFAEGRYSTTYTSTEEWSFEGYKADSIRFLTIGGEIYKKINFRNYKQLLADYTDYSDKVFSDYGKVVYINPGANGTGTLVVYGQYQPYIDITDENGTTVFSDWNEEANEAIVEKMTSSLKRREHLPDEAELHDQRAVLKLKEIWDKISKEQSEYQTQDDDGMFKRFDVLKGGFRDDLLNEDQF